MIENLQCALTGKLLPREETIKFVIGPDNAVIADLSEELPGEGIRLLGYRGTLEAVSYTHLTLPTTPYV